MIKQPNEQITLLLVDDDQNNLDILINDLEDENYQLLQAMNGEEAWKVLQEHKNEIQTILLDRMMPVLDGMGFMKLIKADKELKDIPVIMQTAAAEKKQVVEGIQAGVYYYLTKPYEQDMMLSVVRSSLQDFRNRKLLKEQLNQFKQKLYLVKESFFEAKTLDDISYLSAYLANFYPESEKVIIGISELLINAVEHGNLGITYEEKSHLVRENLLFDEISKRLDDPANQNKAVKIHFRRETDHIKLHIKDEGNGFNWKKYLEFDPDRITHNHGRGIAMTKMQSFDEIEYLGKGNEVICRYYLKGS